MTAGVEKSQTNRPKRKEQKIKMNKEDIISRLAEQRFRQTENKLKKENERLLSS